MPDALRLALRSLRLLPAECAHDATLWLLRRGLVPARPIRHDPALAASVFGLAFASPLGLAAGFDKNAVALSALCRLGFGFIEVGGVTPRPQAGNPRPRLFRLAQDGAVINRMGLNNEGMEAMARRLEAFRAHTQPASCPIGVNLGPNKDSPDPAADYEALIARFAGLADYLVLNVSSPNTPGLRALQEKDRLLPLLARAIEARERSHARGARRLPLLLKIAPDLSAESLDGLCAAALACGVDGLVVSNTTVGEREGLKSRQRNESGGLSGKPLLALSTRVLSECHRITGGRLPLIGVGGISSGADAYAKIKAGASLVQLYTALVYEGPALIARIEDELLAALRADGYATLGEAVGAAHRSR